LLALSPGTVASLPDNTALGRNSQAISVNGARGTQKIVAVGTSVDFAVVRYNPDGSLDSSFGGTGKILIRAGVYARSVAIQPNGKIVVAGITFIDGDSVFAVARLNPNGSVDTSFNGTGIVITSVGKLYGNASYDEVGLVAIQADGKIVVAGDSGPDEFKSFVAVRYQGDAPSSSCSGVNPIDCPDFFIASNTAIFSLVNLSHLVRQVSVGWISICQS
jgi:uncharacterized delta-60 repeat protein